MAAVTSRELVDRSEWWHGDVNPNYPALSHGLTSESLWLKCNRDWIDKEELNKVKYASTKSAPSPVTTQDRRIACVNSLRACSKSKDLHRGTKIHDDILKSGLLEKCSDALITMYAQCGELEKAKELLDMHKSVDVVTWTALISSYTRGGQAQNALDCFERMQCEGIAPNVVTYTSILKACASVGAIEKGKEVYDVVVKQGLFPYDTMLGNAIIDMYVKCGALSKARDVLEKLPSRDVVSWSTLIAGYVKESLGEQALDCFDRMQREGIHPNAVTYVSILKAYATLRALDKGEKIHHEVAERGFLNRNIELGTALLDMYAKCGALSKAQNVFDSLPSRDVISWNALIAGYVQEGQGEQALVCFDRMQHEGMSPNAATYACILKACASIGAADKGKEIYNVILQQGLLQEDIMVGNAIVDMYAKCGALSKAQDVLEMLPSRDVVTWNALITGLAQDGQGERALESFERMQLEGITPDAVTFLCVLNVCSHLGLIEEGYSIFMKMNDKYGVSPSSECVTCMVDLFGRAGHLERAVQLIQEMPSFDCSANWIALLGACRKWGDVEAGKLAYQQAARIDKFRGPASVLMGDIYAAAEMKCSPKITDAKREGREVHG